MLRAARMEIGQIAPGQLFAGRYRILRLLKAGGMGAVYEATHEQTRRRVALKVMRPEIVSDPVSRQRFVQEAQVATIIESKHVVDVLDAGVDEQTGIPFLVMEFLTGEELGDLVQRQGRLAASDVVTLLSEAARALDKAHARGIVHRDLKPENLYLVLREDEPPTLKILDFGIAKVLQSVAHNSTRGTGTPLYMAPEQTRRSSQVGPPTDVWALGLVAYTLLVGRPYWEAEDVHQLLGEILVEPLENPVHRALRSQVQLPVAFEGWFFSCVNRDPSLRYARAGQAIAALGAVFGVAVDQRLAAPLPPPPPPPPPPITVASTMPLSSPPSAALAATTAAPVQSAQYEPPGVERGKSKLPFVLAGIGAVAILGGVAIGLALRNDDPPKTAAEEPKPKEKETATTKASAVPFPQQVAKKNAWITVGSLAFQKHEVTRGEFALYVASLPEKERPKARPMDDWVEPIDEVRAKIPVTWVTYERAAAYCKAIGARLPKTTEWTQALGKKYPWGDAWPAKLTDIAIARGEDALPIEVDTSPIDHSPDDIADLAGNVQEWTSTVDAGLAMVRGASIAMPAEDAKGAIAEGLQKYTEEGAGSGAKRESIAGARLGFRCVKDR